MDGTRFDGLTRVIARVGTRRQAIAALAAALGGAAVAGGEVSVAATRCRVGRQTCSRDGQCCSGTCQRGKVTPLKDRNRCACGDGETLCGNICADLAHDERNCGACGAKCATGSLCCPDGCIDAKTDVDNCGACGNQCGDGSVCCNGVCIDIEADPANCGSCGYACGADGVCVSGMCSYPDRCAAEWNGESEYCFRDAAGNAYMNPVIMGHLGTREEPRAVCTTNDSCQWHIACDLPGHTCACLVNEQWGPTNEDGGDYYPGDCYVASNPTGCPDPAFADAPYCVANIEGDAWGTTREDEANYNSGCLSSEECFADDELCADPEYGCGCIEYLVDGSNFLPGALHRCYRAKLWLPG
jgi:hypothetical protein